MQELIEVIDRLNHDLDALYQDLVRRPEDELCVDLLDDIDNLEWERDRRVSALLKIAKGIHA